MKINNRIWVYPFFILGMLLIQASSCENEEPLTPLTVTDIDGNVYHTVTIGTQVWLVENLKVTKFNDGTPIPFATDNSAWASQIAAVYCWYNNDSTTHNNTYGALYNWYTVNTDKLCPTGWHVPTDDEWTTLIDYLGNAGVAGGKLKEVGTAHWLTPNTGADNESGFTALPSGYRRFDGEFFLAGNYGYWWSSTEIDDATAWTRYLSYNSSGVIRYQYEGAKSYGYSVRCLKD